MLLFSLLFLVSLAVALIPKKDFKPEVFILTDISNEPDDAESLVRLLLYSNEVDIKGLVATTSYWLNYTVHDEDIYPILEAYGKVHKNLLKHSKDYPSVSYFKSIVAKGSSAYGLLAFDQEKISEGAVNLIKSIDEAEESLFVLIWGGANTLAEALKEVSSTRSTEEVDLFASKIVAYSISDQDNAGPWIRKHFPGIKYIASVHGFSQYGHSAWVGISGDIYNFVDFGGPDTSLVTKEWVNEKVRSVGPLGKAYPMFLFNMEGDTPSTLYVLPNGLSDPHEPSFGSWGGRYTLSDISLVSGNHYGDALDYAIGKDNRTHVSAQASIWRWREAFQNDFEARMQWTVKSFEDAPHQPIIVTNGSVGYLPMVIDIVVGNEVVLDASESYDQNNNSLTFKWFHYIEPSLSQGNILEIPEIEITKLNDEGSIVSFTAPEFQQACFNVFSRPLEDCKKYHIVLEVTNNGTPSLTTYRRFILSTDKGNNTFESVEYKQAFFNGDATSQGDDDIYVHDEL
ncbi:hypothetical protein PSN45_004863 [Yamadazyma tenuis]|uniref:DUF1593-domain-containing protein n=1 Tax=Candida tenuis (strain ATCC 10573 / BCRC 21748 / CBS 615 / JCM 9827 / NBRC 10315 / NRRL Y-1498 / VKM Y-70) TaxID=590646 RepID=G3B1X1_CANTC|nr:DUF1593-domain-containing protein [Yamadazyma tenuis ATCC 10573]EGV64549.1 DUF1593-domain-containing protein [Yamadazyma tenuis ATCC 10573]WEJ97313.1 hypothetical protein PSN45_004863 [Yamadazyma tenuis]